MIFDLYTNERIGVSKITRRLNENGFKARKGNWTPSTIKDILKNPAYIGKIRWNHRKNVKKVIDGKIESSRPRNFDCELVEGLHEPLIDENVFNLAQEYIGKNRVTPSPHNRPIMNSLAGIVKCKLCHRNMVRRPYNDRKQEDKLMCPYTDCKNVSSPLSLVEEMILEALRNIKFENKHQERIVNTKVLEKNKDNINKEIETLKQQKASLHDLLEQGIYDTNTFLERSKIINNKIADLEQNIKNIEKEINSFENKETIIPKIAELLLRYDNLSIKEKNEMLKTVLLRVEYLKTKKATKKDATQNIELKLITRI
jgi:hypothetical protein